MNQQAAGEQRKTVFISYSRVDGAFAEKLRTALIARGYKAYLDKEDILPGEPWRARIDGLILAADAVVFVMSPSSIASEICAWEVGRALELKKTLTPLHWAVVPSHAVPSGLSMHNYVFFDAYQRSSMQDEAAFELSITQLQTALNVTDNLWVREHTKWVARAVEWDRAERPEGQLLRFTDISALQAWANRRPKDAQIPDVVFEFVDASLRKEEHDRQELFNREQRISQRTQSLVANEARRAREAFRHASALRLALAAEPSDDARLRGIVQDPLRHAELAAAAHTSLGLAWLSGHSGPITCAVFSPDGTRLVTGSEDGTARVWDAGMGDELVRMNHDGPLRAAVFSPGDTRLLATACGDVVRLWDGTQILALAHDEHVTSVAFSAGGTRLVTASGNAARVWDTVKGVELCRMMHKEAVTTAVPSGDGERVVTLTADRFTARLWHVTRGEELARLTHKHTINSVAFSPDGAHVVSASDDNSARVWECASGKELARLIHSGCVAGASFSPDGTQVITRAVYDKERDKLEHDPETGGKAGQDFVASYRVVGSGPWGNTACIWNALTGAEVRRLKHDGPVSRATFSTDGARVLTLAEDRIARLWDAQTGVELVRLVHEGPVTSAVLSPDGGCVASVCGDGDHVRLWSTSGAIERSRLRLDSAATCAVFSPDGSRVVTGAKSANPNGRDTTIEFWDAASGRNLISRIDHHPLRPVEKIQFSVDGTRLLTLCDGKAHVWDVGTESKLVEVTPYSARAALSPDGTRVVTADLDATYLWDAATGAELLRQANDGSIECLAFSPDATSVAIGSSQGILLWDVANGKTAKLAARTGHVMNSVAFSHDGRRLVTGSDDRTACVWDAATGSEIIRIVHDAFVCSAVFNHDGTRIATAAGTTVYVWDAASGAGIHRFTHGNPVDTVAFSADGAEIVTACRDRVVRIWDVTWVAGLTGDRLVRAVARAGLAGDGRLTAEEQRLLHPLLGDVDPDVVTRWLQPSPDDAAIDDALAKWRAHRAMSLALMRADWEARASRERIAPVRNT